MNPDHYPTKKSTGYKVWTLIKGGTVYIFRMYYYDSDKVEVCSPDGEVSKMTVEAARGVWEALIGHGFVIQNECHHWDMDEFYSMKREKERTRRKTQRMKSAMTSFDKMKKELKYENYALEA